MAIYMKLPYASGSVTAAKYEKWIDVDSLHFGVDRSVSMETSSLNNRGSGVPHFKQFAVTKGLDESSPLILEALVNKKSGDVVEIAVVEAKDSPKEIVRYILKDAIVASYTVAGSGDRPHENLSFTYSEFEMAVTPRSTGNQGTATIRFSHNLKKD